MGARRQIALMLVVVAAGLAIAPVASGLETKHIYPVTLTITVDHAAGKLDGAIVTDAPSEFCDSSTIRVRRVMPGKDTVIARIAPYAAEFHIKSTAALRGARVYAEVSRYHLPSRPVECLEARSNTVTAP
jgi:hypothetical protein